MFFSNNKPLTNCYINASSDFKNCIFIMNCFLKFNQTLFFMFHIPNEIFRLIIEYYYNYCISKGLCKKFKCIQNFKEWFDPDEQVIYHHCLNPKCHRENTHYELDQCILCDKMVCVWCFYSCKLPNNVLKLCFICKDKIDEI